MAEQYKTNRRQDMKKKLLSILLVTATLLCFGCGGGSSSATNSGNSGGSANNSSDAKQTGDLYGTKKPVSATYTFKRYSSTVGPYPMTFVFNDDGSYVATVEWGITQLKLYFSKTGVIEKSESYDPSTQEVDTHYCINGVSGILNTTSTEYGVNRAEESTLLEFRYSGAKPDYDSDGNIANTTAISTDNGDMSVERDADGRITKTSWTKPKQSFSSETTYYTKYIYSDNSVYMLSYNNDYYKGGYKVTYNSNGAISEAVSIKEDGSENSDTYTYTYDEYGFLTSIKSQYRTVTIEYTY
jgi:YD repeat-containing protein